MDGKILFDEGLEKSNNITQGLLAEPEWVVEHAINNYRLRIAIANGEFVGHHQEDDDGNPFIIWDSP
jgi:hypothetical protein